MLVYSLQRKEDHKHLTHRAHVMDTQKIIEKGTKENPEIALVLEISARAREIDQREPMIDLRPASDIAANPTAAQGSIHYSGHVLTDERHLIP